MVNRYYVCDACDYSFCVKQELHDDKRLKRCPQCKKHKLYQDLTGQHTFIYSEPQTLGHQAARNTERAGKYQLESIQREQKLSKEKVQLDNLKKAGLVKQDAEELPSSKTMINPEGENLRKKLQPILNEPNAKVRKKKIKDYIVKGT
jgi:predicted ATP-dependent serine protease